MKATDFNGILKDIPNCRLLIPGAPEIRFNNLPDISDSKSAIYSDEPVIGRAMPIKTFSHGESRIISMSAMFFVVEQSDINKNISILRAIQSAVYPRNGNGARPYRPPPVCKLRCLSLLSREDLCVIMKDYSTKFPTDVPWDQSTGLPYRLEVSMTFEVVYPSSQLPGQEKILTDFYTLVGN